MLIQSSQLAWTFCGSLLDKLIGLSLGGIRRTCGLYGTFNHNAVDDVFIPSAVERDVVLADAVFSEDVRFAGDPTWHPWRRAVSL